MAQNEPLQQVQLATTPGGLLVDIKQKVYPWKDLIKTEKKFVTLVPGVPRKAGINNKSRNIPSYRIGGFKMPDKDYWLGFPIGNDKEGVLKWKRLFIEGSKQFNLNKQEQAYEFFIWQNSPKFKGSILSIHMGERQEDLLIIDDPDADAQEYLTKRNLAREVENTIMECSDDDIKDWGLIFKIHPNQTGIGRIRKMLLEKLFNNPKKFMKDIEWNGDTDYITVKKVLRKAAFAGITREDPGRGYVYKEGRVLGHNEEAAIKLILKDEALFAVILDEANEAMPTSNIMSISKNANTIVKDQGNDDDVVSRVMKQIKQDYDLVPKTSNVPDINSEIDEAIPEKRIKGAKEMKKKLVSEPAGFDSPDSNNTIEE